MQEKEEEVKEYALAVRATQVEDEKGSKPEEDVEDETYFEEVVLRYFKCTIYRVTTWDREKVGGRRPRRFILCIYGNGWIFGEIKYSAQAAERALVGGLMKTIQAKTEKEEQKKTFQISHPY